MGEPSLHATENINQSIDKNNSVHIRLQQIDKSFGNHPVLKDLSLDIEAGQFVVIVGKSGSGKSTLLRLAAGLEKPTTGNITFDDISIQKSTKKPTMMYQDSRLLPWKTVLHNVGLGLRGKWQEKAEDVLDHVGLRSFQNEWPSKLSGGQKQRVSLARALMHHPPLLLLDEPLSALDALTRMEMQTLIEKLWLEQGFTALLVTHDVREAITLGDRIILIEDGTITFDIDNPASRPRTLTDPSLHRLETDILNRIMQSN